MAFNYLEEEFDAERTLAGMLLDGTIFTNSFWWEENWPEDAKEMTALCVNCNDVFAWACADAEGIKYEELEDLFILLKKDPQWGAAVWCMIKRKQMPQKPVEKEIKRLGIWDLKSLKLGENTQDAEVQALFASLRNAQIANQP